MSSNEGRFLWNLEVHNDVKRVRSVMMANRTQMEFLCFLCLSHVCSLFPWRFFEFALVCGEFPTIKLLPSRQSRIPKKCPRNACSKKSACRRRILSRERMHSGNNALNPYDWNVHFARRHSLCHSEMLPCDWLTTHTWKHRSRMLKSVELFRINWLKIDMAFNAASYLPCY